MTIYPNTARFASESSTNDMVRLCSRLAEKLHHATDEITHKDAQIVAMEAENTRLRRQLLDQEQDRMNPEGWQR